MTEKDVIARQEAKGIIVEKGRVTEALPAGNYRVELDNGSVILAHISGRMKQNFIRVFPGQEVRVEMSKHDKTKGRIVFRY